MLTLEKDSEMTRSRVNVGVIGSGRIGAVHARNLARETPGARVVAVMDVDEERVASLAAECDAKAYADAFALISDKQVQAVLIASPDVAHAEQALACIEAGKPLLCEKPLATTSGDARRIVEAELRAGRRLLQVGFMREYDRSHRDALAIVQSGQIGRALRFRSVHINPYWSGDMGVDKAITNSLIHDIHSARWMMASEIRSVQLAWTPADAAEPLSARYAVILLGYEGGAIGTLEWNGDSGYGYEVEVEITGESGMVATTGNDRPTLRRAGVKSQAVTPDWPQRFADAYRTEVNAWIGSILRGQPTGPSAWDGYMSLEVAEACIRAARSGATEPVQGRARPDLY